MKIRWVIPAAVALFAVALFAIGAMFTWYGVIEYDSTSGLIKFYKSIRVGSTRYAWSSFADWQAAEADESTEQVVLVGRITLTSNLTPTKALCVRKGGMIDTNTNSKTLNLSNITFEAGDYQVFDSAEGQIAGLSHANPKWWGAAGDYVSDDSKAIQAAVTAADDIFFPPGTYKLTSAITLDSGDTLRGVRGRSVIKQSANANILQAWGTSSAHLTDIIITNLRFVGTQAGFQNEAVNMEYVKRVKITDNDFQDINPVFMTASDSFADIDDNELNEDIMITGNVYDNNTLSAGGGSLIFIRFAKHGVIANNVLRSRIGDQKSQAIELYGGDGNPASQGTLANAAKCHHWSIANNVMQDMAAGIAVVQSHAVTVVGNAAHNCREVYWSGGRTYDISWIGNTDFEDAGSPIPFQTQGINGHTLVQGNTFRLNTTAGIPLWIGPTWESRDNSGPVIFENNLVVSGATPTTMQFTSIGHLVLRNNSFHNVRLNTYKNTNGIGRLDVEGNDFTYDTVGGIGSEATYMIRLNGICDNVFAGHSGASTSRISPYARFANNTVKSLVDYGTARYVFYPNHWSGAGIFIIEGNRFYSPGLSPRWEIQAQQAADNIDTTFVIRDNVFSQRADFRALSGNKASIFWRNNWDTYGRPYFSNSSADHPWPEAGDAEPSWRTGTVLEGRVSLADDAATSFGVRASTALVEIIAGGGTGFSGSAILDTDARRASATKLTGAETFVASTGALKGSTGEDGNVTVSAHTNGAVYLENRSGRPRHFHFKITIMSENWTGEAIMWVPRFVS